MFKIREVYRALIMVFSSVCIAILALTAVYLLPTEKMRSHVESSIEIFYTEETYPQQAAGYKLSQLDNETDAYMLLDAIYPRESMSALKAAMKVPRIGYAEDSSGRRELVSWLWLKKEPDEINQYARYWHGYLIFLKPLLLLLDYADIRILNMIVQLFLFSALIAQMTKKGCQKYIVPLLAALAVVNPAAVSMSLQFSAVYYIVLITGLYLCSRGAQHILKNDSMIFTAIGIATAFFDFLTYPEASLGMAVVFALMIIDGHDWKQNLLRVIKWCVFWGIGYAGMWSCKWLAASVILQEDVMRQVIGQASSHTSSVAVEGESYSALQIIWKNIRVFLKWPYLLLGLGIGGCFAFKAGKKFKLLQWTKIIPFLAIAFLPVVWLGFMKNHSYWCYWYTYRGLMVTVFAVLCGFMQICPHQSD